MSSRVLPALALAVALGLIAASADARPNRRPAALPKPAMPSHVAFMDYLHDGRIVTVRSDGRVTIAPARSTAASTLQGRVMQAIAARNKPQRTIALALPPDRYGPLTGEVPELVRKQIVTDLERPKESAIPGQVIVVFKPGVTIAQDRDELTPAAAQALRKGVLSRRHDLSPHRFTNDARMNVTLMQLGVDRAQRLFSNLDRAVLGSMRGRAQARSSRALAPLDNAFVLHVGATTVQNAVRTLRASSSVAHVTPDYIVSSMMAGRHPVPQAATREIEGYRRSTKTFGRSTRAAATATTSTIPNNTAVAFNMQAMLNAPGVDAVAAFDEIGRRFGQLPGTGEIITNVGIGDVNDASAVSNPNDPCHPYVVGGGTTHVIGGQRYLDWPSLPLIPVWVADAKGNLSTTAEVCGVDPLLLEVGLDFSVMAPLPHDVQRPGEVAPFGIDLLGIAPGASYRWVAPATTNGGIGLSTILGSFIGAARQQPAPNVITASLGFGADLYGFPGRYLEDDALTQSVVASIVASNIVVCISSNDGTRTYTGAAIGPSGGSAPTNVGTTGFTDIDDVYNTTAPSVVPDSGAIAVGATTLDDIFSANPQDPASGALANVKAFPETRFNGLLGYSSGFGSRVNLSAPGDNIIALYRNARPYDAVGIENTGGTSASAPEVAAAAAVALQVARLTGKPLTSAVQVRDLLVATATPVANPPQADVALNVGPQVSVRRVVENLLAAAGKPVQPGIARVAIHGRRSGSYIAISSESYVDDAAYVTALDPSFVKLDGPFAVPTRGVAFPGSDTGADLNSYVTIAPDWEGLPNNASYRLAVTGEPSRVVATTPSARMLPAQLFAAAGVPLTPGVSRTLSMTYSASLGLHVVAQSSFQITFGPPAPSSRLVLAPKVPPVVSGASIPVQYDISAYPSSLARAPALMISLPGATNLEYFNVGLYPCYSVPLSGTKGTVNVPVSALAGAGTYSIWIAMQPGTLSPPSDQSDFAFTRVDAGTARPPAPMLSLSRSGPTSHTLTVPYKGTFLVTYDVSKVPRATGAIVELAAPPPGPSFFASAYGQGLNTFRNPNGNGIDDDGVVTGSVYHVGSSGTAGTVTIDPAAAGVPVTATVNVRIIPTAAGTPIAEASDAGIVEYQGLNTLLGLDVALAFINPQGSDGYLAEAGSAGGISGSVIFVEPFDLATGTIAGIMFTDAPSAMTLSPILQNDDVLASDSADYVRMNYYVGRLPGGPFSSIAFPAGSMPSSALIATSALNSTPTRSAHLGIDLLTGAFIATRGDVTTGMNFSPGIDLTPVLGPNPDTQGTSAIAYDTIADRGYMLIEDATLPCEQQSPRLVTIEFATGTASSRTLPIGGGIPGLGHGYQMAVDSVTHVAAIATSCQYPEAGRYIDRTRSELTLVDLNSGTVSNAFRHALDLDQTWHGYQTLIGGDSAVIGIDPVNHLVLQRSLFCPQPIPLTDVNARACLNEYDESGRLVKTIRGLFSDGFADFGIMFNGVNGTTRTGVANGQEVYGWVIASKSVQPYSY